MFVGHYGVSLAAKKVAPSVSLATLFVAVQLLDVGWSLLVLLGVEKVRIVPGITATNPLDLYYMPYTHSLVAAVLSHWILDFLVHRPDLPLYGDSAKVGMGLWNFPASALVLEVAFLFGGLWLYFQTGAARRTGLLIFAVLMVAIQGFVFFGPPPASDRAAALTALAAYAVFAAIIALLERRNDSPAPR